MSYAKANWLNVPFYSLMFAMLSLDLDFMPIPRCSISHFQRCLNNIIFFIFRLAVECSSVNSNSTGDRLKDCMACVNTKDIAGKINGTCTYSEWGKSEAYKDGYYACDHFNPPKIPVNNYHNGSDCKFLNCLHNL